MTTQAFKNFACALQVSGLLLLCCNRESEQHVSVTCPSFVLAAFSGLWQNVTVSLLSMLLANRKQDKVKTSERRKEATTKQTTATNKQHGPGFNPSRPHDSRSFQRSAKSYARVSVADLSIRTPDTGIWLDAGRITGVTVPESGNSCSASGSSSSLEEDS